MADKKDKEFIGEDGRNGSENNAGQAESVEKITLTPEEAEEFKNFMKKAEETAGALAEQKDQYLRLLAEYDNYRKRSHKEKEQIYPDAVASAILAILPVYDNLERALNQPCQDEAFLKGITLTMNQFKDALKSLGVSEIPAQGQKFDPAKHDAVMHVEDEACGENTVAEVLRSGFQMGDRVLRCAMVKVAN
jgi:molecular chaperone GrpE